MTSAVLRVSHEPQQSPAPWRLLVEPSAGFDGAQIPSASYYNGVTYIGYIDGVGSIRVAAYNHTSHLVTVSPAIISGFAADIHVTPSVLVRSSDHKIVVAVAAHNASHNFYIAISTNAEDISAWGAATDIGATIGLGSIYTYANLFQLSGESGKIWLFFQLGNPAAPPTPWGFTTSTDGGATWAAGTTLYEAASLSSYATIASDDTSRIDFVVTDGTVGDAQTGSLYHFYYSGGSYHKSDGAVITAGLPLAPSNLTKIYDGTTNGDVRVPFGVLVDGPTAVWAAANAGGWSSFPENYWYGRYSGGVWNVHDITDSGQVENTQYAEGGLTLDPTDAARVFLSKSGQIYTYKTSDGGSTWTSMQLTNDTDEPNLRPSNIRDANSELTVLWQYGPYLPNGGFGTQIRGYPGR